MPNLLLLVLLLLLLACREEGFHYDPLPRETFVATLDETEQLLGLSPGPFFCGGSFSAADVVWASLWAE